MLSRPAHARDDSILLDLDIERERSLLEFDAAEDRAFSVGSSAHADVRVRRDGVPPVAFYLERRKRAVWLVPAYRRSSLRVDGAIVVAPYRVRRTTVIEFSRVRAQVVMRGETLDDRDEVVAPEEVTESTRRARLAYLEALPDVHDRTVVDPDPEPRDDPASERSAPKRGATPARERTAPRSSRREISRALRPPTAPSRSAPAPSPPRAPHLWTLLEQRPLEAVVFVLLIGLVIVLAALAAAAFLRLP